MLISKPFSRLGSTSMARIEKPYFFKGSFVDYVIQVTDEYIKGMMFTFKGHQVIDRFIDKEGQKHIKLYYIRSANIRFYATLIFKTDDTCSVTIHKSQVRRRRRK